MAVEPMTIVIIAEKPSVANDLANVLEVKEKKETHWHSDNVVITWACLLYTSPSQRDQRGGSIPA